MLIDSQNREHFAGLSRGLLDRDAGGKSPAGQERRQAEMLKDLREVHVLSHNKHQGFSLGERARLI